MLNIKAIFTNLILLLFLVSTQFSSRAMAQSGRPAATPRITPEVSPIPETKIQNPVCEESVNELEFIDLTERDEFIQRINRYGSCGYRLEKIARFPFNGNDTLEQISFTGLVKKDENNKYEYRWFVAETPGQAQTLANKLADDGFYLKKAMSFVVGACGDRADKIQKENSDGGVLERLAILTVGDKGIFFLFERKVGSPKKNEYRVIDAEIPNTKFKENERKMQNLAAKGFRPVELWYSGFLQYHFLIMEKDDDIKPEGEYIFDKELYGVSKDLTKYAEKGFKLLIMGTGLSVLQRTSQTPQNVRYYSFHKFKEVQKNLSTKLKNATLVETGLDYYPVTCDPFENRWFFSVPLKEANTIQKKDVRFLNIWDFKVEFIKRKGLSLEIPLTKEQINEFEQELNHRINQLSKENYEVINFNYLDGFTIMFERFGKLIK